MPPLFGKLCPSAQQTFRSPGSIVGVLDRPSAAQEASSSCSTDLPQPRKHRRSARQHFRSPGSIVELFPLDDFRRILMAKPSFGGFFRNCHFCRMLLHKVSVPVY